MFRPAVLGPAALVSLGPGTWDLGPETWDLTLPPSREFGNAPAGGRARSGSAPAPSPRETRCPHGATTPSGSAASPPLPASGPPDAARLTRPCAAPGRRSEPA